MLNGVEYREAESERLAIDESYALYLADFDGARTCPVDQQHPGGLRRD